MPLAPAVKQLGLVAYEPTWQAMQAFTEQRDPETPDEIWVCQHPPVYTLGKAGDPKHVLNPPSHIPLIPTDRGGQVTYHGPGQLIVYPLLNLKRRQLSAHALVNLLEQATIDTLAEFGIQAQADTQARGIYVEEKKIGSIGLRIRRGCSYHGVAINVAMDLTPFSDINPCGYADLKMTQCSELNPKASLDAVTSAMITHFVEHLNNHARTKP